MSTTYTTTTSTDVSAVTLAGVKSAKERHHLGSHVAALLYLDDVLPQAGENSGSSSPDLTDLPTYTTKQMQQLMAEVNAVLSSLEEKLMAYQYATSQTQSDIGQLNLQEAQDQLTNIKSQIAQYNAEVQAQQNQPWWKTMLDIVLPIISVVASVFMGPEMMMLTVTMLALQYSGAFTALTNALVSAGCPQWAADLVVTAIVVVASVVCGSMGSAAKEVAEEGADAAANAATSAGRSTASEAASLATRAGSEAADEVAEEAAEEVESTISSEISEGASDAETASQKLISGLKKILQRLKPFQRLDNGIKTGAVMELVSLGQTGFFTDVLKQIPANLFPGGEAEKDKFVEYMGLALTVLAMVVAMVIGKCAKTTELDPQLNFNVSARFATAGNYATIVAAAGAQAGESYYNVEMAQTEDRLSAIQSELSSTEPAQQLFQDLIKICTSFMQATSNGVTSDIQDVAELNNEVITSFLKPIQKAIQVLMQ